MAGEAVPAARWDDIADHVEARVGECVFPFLSAHHGYALARAGRDGALGALRATMQERTARDDAEAARVWRPIGQDVVEGCIALGEGQHALSADLLDGVIGQVTAGGGSDAQDDLFRQTYFCALVGAGRAADAGRQWAAMTAFKELSPLDDRFRARC